MSTSKQRFTFDADKDVAEWLNSLSNGEKGREINKAIRTRKMCLEADKAARVADQNELRELRERVSKLERKQPLSRLEYNVTPLINQWIKQPSPHGDKPEPVDPYCYCSSPLHCGKTHNQRWENA
jgi:hypothetical protein